MTHPVFGETVRGDSCQKLAKEMEDGAKFIKKHHIPPMVYSELYYVLGEIWRTGRAETILQEIKNIYTTFGFEATEKGIGWVIS